MNGGGGSGWRRSAASETQAHDLVAVIKIVDVLLGGGGLSAALGSHGIEPQVEFEIRS
jgi:hypothetical protein